LNSLGEDFNRYDLFWISWDGFGFKQVKKSVFLKLEELKAKSNV